MPKASQATSQVAALEQQLASRDAEIETLKQERGLLETRIADLSGAAHAAQHAAATQPADVNQFGIDSLAQALKAVLEAFPGDTTQATATGVAASLRSIEVEVKGFVGMREQAIQITVPKPGEPVDPDTLSVFRLAFVAVPAGRLDGTVASGD